MTYDNMVCKEQSSKPRSHYEILDTVDDIADEDYEDFDDPEIEEYLQELEEDLEYDDAAMPSFSSQITTYKLLTAEQEQYYVKLLHSSCKEEQKLAKDTLILHNMRLVYSVACRYSAPGLTLDDLVQEGVVGLMNAIDRYNPDISKFSTYAVFWIRQAVRRAVCTQDRIIRLPVHMYDRLLKMKRIQSELMSHNIEITEEVLAREMGLSIAQVREVQRLTQETLSLNQILSNEDGGDAELGDYIEDTNAKIPEDNVINEDVRYRIDLAMESLTPKERNVITLYYGLNTDSRHTLESIGKQMGVTRERVRQIKINALRKLSSPKNRQVLGSLVPGNI